MIMQVPWLLAIIFTLVVFHFIESNLWRLISLGSALLVFVYHPTHMVPFLVLVSLVIIGVNTLRGAYHRSYKY